MRPSGPPQPGAIEPVYPETASSGIEGLDQIMGGGFLRDDMHLVQGSGGTGKTTLALQFLRAGVLAGESGLYITLSQSRKGLESIARSHGWPLDGVTIHELSPADIADPLASQTVLHTADVELREILIGIRQSVVRAGPRRAVFDSLGTLGELAGSPHRYRSEVVGLRRMLTEAGCTALFLADQPAEADPVGRPPNGEFHALVGSVVHLEQSPPDYGEVRRRARIVKVRGMPHHGGYHNFRIATGGIEVFPRLSGYDKPEYTDFTQLASGIAELDELLGGGLERGTATLLIGASGVGKSTLGSLYAHAAVRSGDPAAIFLFDERPETFLARAVGVGVDIRPFVDDGRIQLRQLDTGTISPGEFSQRVREVVEGAPRAKLVVLDSLTGYFNAMGNQKMLIEQMHDLLNYLNRNGTLTILTVTQPGIESVGGGAGMVDISYLSDTIIVIKQFEAGATVRRGLAAIKKRQGEHETTIRELMINPGGISVGAPLTGLRSILSGDPKPVGNLDE